MANLVFSCIILQIFKNLQHLNMIIVLVGKVIEKNRKK
jgi:hypothetical protein